MNQIIIEQMYALAIQTQQDEGNSFRVRSHYKIIKLLKELDFEINNISQIEDIRGIGKSTITRIDEIIKYGSLNEIKTPSNNISQLKELERITGIGPVKAKKLFKSKITLESILNDYKTGKLPDGFTNHQLLGIKHFHDLEKRIKYKEITLISKFIQKELEKIYNEVDLEICGSYRRKMDTSGDIDILFYSKNKDEHKSFLPIFLEHLNNIGFLVDHLTSLDSETKYMGMCKYKSNPVRRIDIRYIPKKSIGSAKLYFTGSGDFNKNMRTYALKNGFTLNEYGIFKLNDDKSKGPLIKTLNEKDIFDTLKLEYVEPENRLSNYEF
jgi:DNA polymerase beta